MKIALTVECQGGVTPGDLERVAAAIQVQVSRDFGPIWGIDATVTAFERLEQVPLGYWPVILTSRELDEDNRFQITPSAGAFSVVGVLPGWPITASQCSSCLPILGGTVRSQLPIQVETARESSASWKSPLLASRPHAAIS
jgi:hypothetical protein